MPIVARHSENGSMNLFVILRLFLDFDPRNLKNEFSEIQKSSEEIISWMESSDVEPIPSIAINVKVTHHKIAQ